MLNSREHNPRSTLRISRWNSAKRVCQGFRDWYVNAQSHQNPTKLILCWPVVNALGKRGAYRLRLWYNCEEATRQDAWKACSASSLFFWSPRRVRSSRRKELSTMLFLSWMLEKGQVQIQRLALRDLPLLERNDYGQRVCYGPYNDHLTGLKEGAREVRIIYEC